MITIDEAIKKLEREQRLDGESKNRPLYRNEARQLGIEALKREQQRRKYLVNSTGELLPGETED